MELREQLNSLRMNEVIKRIEFLNDNQRRDFQRTIYQIWRGQAEFDEGDVNSWNRCKIYYWSTIPLILTCRYVSDKMQLATPFQNPLLNSLRKIAKMYRGSVLGIGALLVPVHGTIEYSMRTGYKHYILSQQ